MYIQYNEIERNRFGKANNNKSLTYKLSSDTFYLNHCSMAAHGYPWILHIKRPQRKEKSS